MKENKQNPAEKQDSKETSSFQFEIVEHLGILSTNSSGWTLQVNLVSYNGRPPKLDIRRFSPNGRMGKGLALTQEEEIALRGFLIQE